MLFLQGNHEYKLLPANAGPIWQMGPVNRLYIYWFLQHRDHFILGVGRASGEKGDVWYWKVAIAGNCWGFSLFFAVPTAAAQAAREKNFSCWNWRVTIAGICWDFSFLRCLLLLGSLPGKKMTSGSGKSFLWNWKAICWRFPVFVWSTASWQTAAKTMIFGLLNNFWVEKRRLLQFAEVSPFCVVYCCLADWPGKTATSGIRTCTYWNPLMQKVKMLPRPRAPELTAPVAERWPPNQSFLAKPTAAW